MLLPNIYIHRFSLYCMVQANCNKTSLKMRQEMILYINIKIGEKWLCHQIAISEKADCQKVVKKKEFYLNTSKSFGQIGSCKVS